MRPSCASGGRLSGGHFPCCWALTASDSADPHVAGPCTAAHFHAIRAMEWTNCVVSADWAARTSFSKGGSRLGKREHAAGARVTKSAFEKYFEQRLVIAMKEEPCVALDSYEVQSRVESLLLDHCYVHRCT